MEERAWLRPVWESARRAEVSVFGERAWEERGTEEHSVGLGWLPSLLERGQDGDRLAFELVASDQLDLVQAQRDAGDRAEARGVAEAALAWVEVERAGPERAWRLVAQLQAAGGLDRTEPEGLAVEQIVSGVQVRDAAYQERAGRSHCD